MTELWHPDKETNALRRPYCACCGLSYTNPKFGGKVIVANGPGQNGKAEVMFCEKCASKDEAQEIYREKMDLNLIVAPNRGLNG